MSSKERQAWRDWIRTLVAGALGGIATVVCGPALGRLGDRLDRGMRTPAKLDFRVVEQLDDGTVLVRIINEGEIEATFDGLQLCPSGRTLLSDEKGRSYKPRSLFLERVNGERIKGLENYEDAPISYWSAAREDWWVDCFGYDNGAQLTPMKLIPNDQKSLNQQRTVPGVAAETFMFQAPAGWLLVNPESKSTGRGSGECGALLQVGSTRYAKILACHWATSDDPDPDRPDTVRFVNPRD
jgi:hypothetical protein